MKAILVSACLLGERCRYDGVGKPCAAVLALREKYRLIPVCPEVLGGLPTPRVPSEIVGDRVVMRNGTDVTENYRIGAERALTIALENECRVAILKEKSPSCGTGMIYNGQFNGTLITGNGVCTKLLAENGIRVLGESVLSESDDVLFTESRL